MSQTEPLQKADNLSEAEKQPYRRMADMLQECPIPPTEILKELPLFLNRSSLGHVLFMDELYRQILDVPGAVFEFGVKWGRTTSLFCQFRALYEPWNISRKVLGFDTFCGFPSVSKEDGGHAVVEPGALAVGEEYLGYLQELLSLQESLAPRPHVRKYELIQGDACETLRLYLEEHPETVCALAYFDFDLFEPTRACAEQIVPHLTKGSIVAFDQLTWDTFPGETRAFQEVFGSTNVRLRRDSRVPFTSYFVYE